MSSSAFDNKWHSSAPSVSEALVTRLVICFVAVGIRIFCQTSRGSRKGGVLDDVFILLALLVSIVSPSILLWGTSKGGSGSLIPVLIEEGKYKDLQFYLLSEFISGMSDYVTLTMIRLSILAFYAKVFGSSGRLKQITFGLAALSILWTTVCIIGYIFLCTPVDHLWDPLGKGVCHNYMLFFVLTEVVETCMDTAILLLPISSILRLQLPMRTRISVAGIFLLGSFVILTNILRIVFTYQPHTNFVDLTKVDIWTSVHISSAMVCACLPLCKPFLLMVVDATNTVTGFTRSLLSTGRGNGHGGTSKYATRSRVTEQGREAPSALNSIRLEDYDSKASFKLEEESLSKYKAEVQGGFKSKSEHYTKPSAGIKVDSEFHVV